MELNEKLVELRRQKGITQEELAQRLYVSRTAISKWESGRGYPSIDSLKAIAAFFSVTVDSLLCADEVLTIAEADTKKRETRSRELLFGLLDISMAMLLFLPFFAQETDGFVAAVPLLSLVGASGWLFGAYLAVVIGVILSGVFTLAMLGVSAAPWKTVKAVLSLSLGAAAVLLFILSSHPYAALFAFCLLAIKALTSFKWR